MCIRDSRGGGGGTTIVQGGGGVPAEVNVNVTVEQTSGGRSGTTSRPQPRRNAPSMFDIAARQSGMHSVDDEEEDDEESPKKKKRFFGLFGGKEEETAKLDPHLKKL